MFPKMNSRFPIAPSEHWKGSIEVTPTPTHSTGWNIPQNVGPYEIYIVL
jgi:hypothetical protein